MYVDQSAKSTSQITHHVANSVADQDVEMVARDSPHHRVAAATDCLNCVLGGAVFKDDLEKRLQSAKNHLIGTPWPR